MPRSSDLVIFVLITTDKTDYITPCACARGNYRRTTIENVTWMHSLDLHFLGQFDGENLREAAKLVMDSATQCYISNQ